MAHGCRSRTTPQGQTAHVAALGPAGKSESLCTVRHEAPGLALPAGGLRRCPSGILRATIHSAIRAPCRKDGAMKRAARHKTGSVVFDKRRRTWNFLWWEDGGRRSKLIGNLQRYPTKGAAWQAAQSFQHSLTEPNLSTVGVITVCSLVEQYRAEKMPQRYSTRRSYEAWLKNHIIPKWGECEITGVQARSAELWLKSLDLTPRSRAAVRGLLRILWDFAMWRGDVPTQRNPMELVTIKGASKRSTKPRSLTVDEFQRFIVHLREPFRTIALVCVCFGLRISECLALRWSDVDWLEGKLGIERGIVRQRIDDVKTETSHEAITVSKTMLDTLKLWKQTTQFSEREDWVFASPAQLG